jgi:hypothetical protein
MEYGQIFFLEAHLGPLKNKNRNFIMLMRGTGDQKLMFYTLAMPRILLQ